MSNELFSSVRNERMYEKIVVQLRQLIADGKLKPGDRLPGERVLSQTLGCSRTSLREACRVLEAEGLIISKPGGGRFVQHVELDTDSLFSLDPIDMLEKSAVLYFLEAREAIEPKIAELASQRATFEDIKKMEAVLLKMEEKLKYPDENVEIDSSFHLAIAEATQNFVFVSMMKANLSMSRQVRKQTLSSEERYLLSLEEHRAILKAVKNKDGKEAIKATCLHLQNIKENVLKNYPT
jgi:GntR family transcriptional regulator, transcriptional repressor for pyruvate dehydrogenase complex